MHRKRVDQYFWIHTEGVLALTECTIIWCTFFNILIMKIIIYLSCLFLSLCWTRSSLSSHQLIDPKNGEAHNQWKWSPEAKLTDQLVFVTSDLWPSNVGSQIPPRALRSKVIGEGRGKGGRLLIGGCEERKRRAEQTLYSFMSGTLSCLDWWCRLILYRVKVEWWMMLRVSGTWILWESNSDVQRHTHTHTHTSKYSLISC